jgi:hypothetical protein
MQRRGSWLRHGEDGKTKTTAQVRCYRSIEFNEAHSLKVYKIDKDMVALGCKGLEILERDASSWPIPADASARDSDIEDDEAR